MQPASKKQRVMQAADQSQLRPDQVKATSNIFGELKEDESESESEEEEEDEHNGSDDEEEEDEEEDDDNEGEPSKKRKKNDPEAFAIAMQKILGAGLTQQNRKNPILARSIESKKLDLAAADAKLDIKARKQIAQERKAALDRNHKEQPNAAESEQAAARVIEKERALRKVAQRGVVRLFNAIRVAQNVDAAAPATSGPAGRKQQEQQQALSKQSFLSLIKASGPPAASP